LLQKDADTHLLTSVDALRVQFLADLEKSENSVEALHIKYLGRNGLIATLMKELAKISPGSKPLFGKKINALKIEIVEKLDSLSTTPTAEKTLDVTLPGRQQRSGSLHPLTQIRRQICEFFEKLGFSIKEGPEIEWDHLNFSALNIDADHPARDMHDTFYFDAKRLLRTHTSPVQIRVMQKGTPPFRVISPGKVYRCDSDVTHSPMFHQIEGLCVDKNVNFGHLKSVLHSFARALFGLSVKLRFRPSYFPFTEPSAEVDISCILCEAQGCRVCKETGWLEILGAGMVHPNVLKNVGVDPEEYSGYAFGLGVERIAMLKYRIPNIRLFYENHLEFLRQFHGY
jgi:phenylalanyl-tRNA synthetase alpha chain